MSINLANTKYLEYDSPQGKKFYAIESGRGDDLREVDQRYILGLAGDGARAWATREGFNTGNLWNDFYNAQKNRGAITPLTPEIIQRAQGGEKVILGGTVADFSPALLSYLGGNLNSQVKKGVELENYLKETNQTFDPNAGYGGPGKLPSLQEAQNTPGHVQYIANPNKTIAQQETERANQNSSQSNQTEGQVYRDQNNNFFYNGQPIDINTFHSLGINETFVKPGQTVSLNQARTGQISSQGTQNGDQSGNQSTADLSGLPPELVGLYTQLEDYLDELEKKGMVLNPNVEITPEKLQEFTKQAETEINPYFSSQLKLSRESLLSDLGYSRQQIQLKEQDLERQYGKQLKGIGEQAAETGFAQSGRRVMEEKDLAYQTQRTLDDTRGAFAQNAGNAARTFAQQYGTSELPGFNLTSAPRALAGESTFQKDTREIPLYNLSSDVYDGLIGEQEFNRRGSVRNRASQLEEAFRTQQGTNQQRNLIL